MISIALSVLRIAWPYLLALVLAFGVYWKANTWCNKSCEAQTVKARTAEGKIRTLEAQLREAQERATALALLWSEQVDKTEAANALALKARQSTFTTLAGRARLVPRGAAIRLPAGAWGVLHDASSAANAARPAAVSEAPADPVSAAPGAVDAADLTASWVAAAAAYADAYGQWQSCVQHYEALQGATNGR